LEIEYEKSRLVALPSKSEDSTKANDKFRGREQRPAKSELGFRGLPDRTFWRQKPEFQRPQALEKRIWKTPTP
jgi:hypothetical protein